MGNSTSGTGGIEIASGVVGGLAVAIGIYALIKINGRSPSSSVAGLTENSFLSKTAAVLTSFLVAYFPLALLWLGPILSILLVKPGFMFPSIISFVTSGILFLVDKLATQPGFNVIGTAGNFTARLPSTS